MPATTRLQHIALIAIAFLTSVGLYSRIPEPYCGPGCTMVLARPMIAFVLPAALAVVVVALGVLWKRDPIRDRDAAAPQAQPRHRHPHSAHVVRSRGMARANRTAGYATVIAGTSFLLAGLLPNLPVLEFATIAVLGIMTMLAWTAWRARHA